MRRAVVVLTPKGREHLARAVVIATRIEDAWAERLGGEAPGGTTRFRAYGLARWLRDGVTALARRRKACPRPSDSGDR